MHILIQRTASSSDDKQSHKFYHHHYRYRNMISFGGLSALTLLCVFCALPSEADEHGDEMTKFYRKKGWSYPCMIFWLPLLQAP